MENNGSILINNEIALSPTYSLEDFIKSNLYNNEDTSIFFWVKQDCFIKNHRFKVGLYFKNRYLKQIQLYCIDNSVHNEEQRKKLNDRILNEIARNTNSEWGSIKSVFDQRDGISLIVINYQI